MELSSAASAMSTVDSTIILAFRSSSCNNSKFRICDCSSSVLNGSACTSAEEQAMLEIAEVDPDEVEGWLEGD